MGVFHDVQEVLPNIDDGDLINQLAVAEYVGVIYKSYQKIEVCFSINDLRFV